MAKIVEVNCSSWAKQTHFVFFILNNSKQIVGAIDIKNKNLDAVEVGYWVSEKYSGLASNALEKLKLIAKNAGYKKLLAQTKANNKKSENVLLRNEFVENDAFKIDFERCDKVFIFEL